MMNTKLWQLLQGDEMNYDNQPSLPQQQQPSNHSMIPPEYYTFPKGDCYEVVSAQPMTVQYPTDFPFELQIPFYMYDNELNWSNMTTCGVDIGRTEYPLSKHSDDYWMLQSALSHPMRTTDPTQAKLFFVPLLLNAIADSYTWIDRHNCILSGTVCFNSTAKTDMLHFADRALNQSVYFQRSHGNDHILVLSHYMAQRKFRLFTPLNNLLSCNRVIFETASQPAKGTTTLPDRIEIPSLYVANNGGCKHRDDANNNKTTDFAMIAAIKVKRQKFRSRKFICSWMRKYNYSHEVCGPGSMCPTLANAKFGFHARGDTFGSNRLVDTIVSGTVPLFTEEEQYNILPDFVPFREMSYFVDVSNEESFVTGMERLSSLSDAEYGKKLALVHRYANRSNFLSGEPFDAYMATFARKLGLQK